MPEAPWYVDFCTDDCEEPACVDAGECAFPFLDILAAEALGPVRRIATIQVAGEVL